MNPENILTSILLLVREYRQMRADQQAAGDPTGAGGTMLTDEELIQLLASDADTLTARLQGLLNKHGE